MYDYGRRIKRTLYINVKSVKFLTDDEIAELHKLDLLDHYLAGKKDVIAHDGDDNAINKVRLTNIGTFRKYMELYLLNHDDITKDEIVMVRQKEMEGRGIPIEVYCFAKNPEWLHYETLQSDIFDHFYAIAGLFNIMIFQEYSNDY
jgi:miniconductance mechanosensitive channel